MLLWSVFFRDQVLAFVDSALKQRSEKYFRIKKIQYFSTYNNDPNKEEDVWCEEGEDRDLHDDVELAVDEEWAARGSEVWGEVFEQLGQDQQHCVQYWSAWKERKIVLLYFILLI